MNEAVFNLLMAVLTLLKDVIEEVTGIVDIAVSAVSQTYVDELKKAGSFDTEAQKQALAMALAACIKAISPAAKAFIEETYGDLTEYLTTYIEAAVRRQKLSTSTAAAALESTSSADTTTVAASTAAATAAAVVQNAIAQTSEK